MKEQIKEICLHYLTLCKSRDDYTPAMVASELADQILALFPQGEGGELFPNTAELFKKPTVVSQPQGNKDGVLCDDDICKAVCKERTRYCAFALKRIDMPCERYDQYKRVAQAQHALATNPNKPPLKSRWRDGLE